MSYGPGSPSITGTSANTPGSAPISTTPRRPAPRSPTRTRRTGKARWSSTGRPCAASWKDEVLIRARTFATEGVDALFAGLETRARWTPPVLELTKHIDADYRAGERRLLLVPLVFAEGCRLYSTDDPEVLTVSFQARGAAALRERPAEAEPGSADRLGLLLGRGRASVLRQLGAPLTTAGISDRLGLAPSTVSEHLSVLADSDVVTRHRVGRSVYYQLTDTGRALLALLSGEDVLRAVS
ncbi:winged helix-turn-helix domain-containing protein [Streptomyces sp. NPDC057136]|uniref:helix-turn-helix domain-containing protein n=1 Tax=Streptomyces sp. NPDC057136 TaxID=3346029 RepID=UPI0036349830